MRSEGYGSLLAKFLCVCVSVCLSVCLSVCYHASEGIARFYAKKEIRTALVLAFLGLQTELTTFVAMGPKELSSWIFGKTFRSLRREKANMLMSICLPRHHMAPMQRYFARIFEDRAFSGSFTV